MTGRVVQCLFVMSLVLVVANVGHVQGMQWEAGWNALVTGSVFCDQCQQKNVFPFGLPMNGAKVSVQCVGSDGAVLASSEATTDIFGGYIVTFKGVSDLGGCQAYVSHSSETSCNIADGGGQNLSLKAKFFFQSFYFVDAMFFKPVKPMSFCPNAPKQAPPFTFPPLPPLTKPPPISFPPIGKPPPFSFPPITFPPFPKAHPSACTYQNWLDSKFFCHLKEFAPWSVTVVQVFGPGAQKKYGSMTLYDALKSNDDLVRQSVTAMLNSLTNLNWNYAPPSIVKYFTQALKASPRAQARTAMKFKRANTGYGKGKCLLTACKERT